MLRRTFSMFAWRGSEGRYLCGVLCRTARTGEGGRRAGPAAGIGRLKGLAILLLMALALASCGAGSAAPPEARQGPISHLIAVESKLLDSSGELSMPDVGLVAPDFQYTLADGTTQKLSDLRGKKVLINFWATWCDPCREEMPDLQKAAQEYGDTLVILGINKLEQVDLIPPFADEFGITFPLIPDLQGDIVNRYGARNIPTSYFINSDGTIGFRRIGVMTYDLIKEQLDQLK